MIKKASRKPISWYWAALSGVLASGAALAIGEFGAGISNNSPSLVESVAEATARSKRVPSWFRNWAIEEVGQAQKPLLIAGIIISTLALGAVLGIFARKLRYLTPLAFAIFGIIGGLTMQDSVGSSTLSSVVTPLFAAGLGAASLMLLLNLLDGSLKIAILDMISVRDKEGELTVSPSTERRNFLAAAAAMSFVFVFLSFFSRRFLQRESLESIRQELLPDTALNLPSPTVNFDNVSGLATYITPNSSFYRIDTAIRVPLISPDDWQLFVTGMVENELTLNYKDVEAMKFERQLVTLSCVSNEVGGNLVGNAYWEGVPLRNILDMAGIDPSAATQIVGRSYDNWTGGFPTELAYNENRVVMLALRMNGEPLPIIHGFPARLVVSGLYGYVSATKWLAQVHLTGWDDFDGYWIPRGWSKEGPIKTQSRIDVPRNNATVRAGRVAVAGVAWAPSRGIDKVEVRMDGRTWQAATLSTDISSNTWRQWLYQWDAEPGDYRIQVRATDSTGKTQTSDLADPIPNGATGWHTISVKVT